ncbi:cobalamin biosynthesis protein CbiD [Mediterraneibacter glycyrrhizinilyticus]|uniref:cobalt-precorrin-5B (C(1))-methyltransferase CbiD n=1 Tax=Mediterraneibacter glycyrrhizinilyticus TaxID=342942 RepID=UPI00195FCC83|nr:cobalt-precorrin-5B (C(1))-methyltransferase CbiD [Mediterraneibacter glycyrrhizinilyticus]MBM6801366.1 cobalamin biosynthesis protein CbiD [Mediterraneibacter glycyrrhizinilyticus]MDM8125900.1 cobalt-precorrin-5B (C(1))-methyltransferase CbiD [Mediterraneibacter glycyrrhizinilyticus]
MDKDNVSKEIGRTRSGLRYGWTTGSCAAAAAKAAAQMLFGGEEIRHVRLMTPKGIELYLDVESVTWMPDYAECAVRKYSGDDPDVTDGLLIFAKVERCGGDQILLDGGAGVGRVTKPGLEQQIGQAAINKVPRKMITEEVSGVCREYGYSGGVKVLISIPEGEETAKKTFNPRLGITGGLSVLGTSGIVEPMSEKALTDTIYLEMKMLHESGSSYCYAVPGNYGIDFLTESMGIDPDLAVKCSNYVGETIDDARLLGMKGLLLIGHVGKFIKLAAGVMNTHSRQADCRMEVFASHAAMAGADTDTVKAVMDCLNTTEAVRILKGKGLLQDVMKTVMERIEFYLRQRAGEELQIGAIVFSSEEGILGQTENAARLSEKIERRQQ